VVEGTDGAPDERRQVLRDEHRHERDPTTDDRLGEPDDDEELGERPPHGQAWRRHHERTGHAYERGRPRLTHADRADAIDQLGREVGTAEQPGERSEPCERHS
jgi:hypothetical protein